MYSSTHNSTHTKIRYMKSIDQYTFARCNSELTFEECIDLIEKQKEKISRLSKDSQKYKEYYDEALVKRTNIEKLNGQIERNESLEDILVMSRATISTLQQKMKNIQEEYAENISTLEYKLNQSYSAEVTGSKKKYDNSDGHDVRNKNI